MFFNKLALSDFRKNAREEKMFLFATIMIYALNIIIHLLQNSVKTLMLQGVNITAQFLVLGEFVIGFFSVIFLIYIHSFLMKSKTKVYGLYYTLGLSRFDLVKISFFAKLWNFIFSMIGGILTGVIFSKAGVLLLGKMLNAHNLTLSIHLQSIMQVILLFSIIFLILLLINIRMIYKISPIALLHAEEIGEKEPKSRWILTVIGFLSLGVGYVISISIQSPIEALFLFFIAALLVIIGTYLLFIVGTIALLKFFKKREKVFYQPRNFISISGMIFRMKQNGTSLANIAVLLTMTLVTLIVSINLSLAADTLSKKLFPKEISLTSSLPKEEYQSLITQEADEAHVSLKSVVNYQMTGMFLGSLKNHVMYPGSMNTFHLMTEEQYAKLEKKSLHLKANQLVILSYGAQFKEDKIQFGKEKYEVCKVIQKIKGLPEGTENIASFIFIVKDEAEIQKISKDYPLINASANKVKQEKGFVSLDTYTLFDLKGSKKDKEKFVKRLYSLPEDKMEVRSKAEYLAYYKGFIAGLLFIGIILGTGFVLAAGLVIYYKQVSEGQADQKNFEILQKVGLSHKEVKKVINIQVFWVFFLPIATTVLHTIFAMPMILKILSAFGLHDIKTLWGFSSGIILGIVVLYYFIYKQTSKAYYKQIKR
ncbi:MAG: hypothetical protein LBS28_04040 [Streptococcaceae bacterium]|nr:hypothetical protein [Streptococcaceae bacterium]